MSAPTIVITGASSGVGQHASKALTDRGWHVVMACRNLEKARVAASGLHSAAEQTTLLAIDLGAQDSVRRFAAVFRDTGLPLDALVCNAAVYLLLLKQPARSPGVHWSWGNRQHAGSKAFTQPLSAKANDGARAARLWELSEALTRAAG